MDRVDQIVEERNYPETWENGENVVDGVLHCVLYLRIVNGDRVVGHVLKVKVRMKQIQNEKEDRQFVDFGVEKVVSEIS